MTVRDATSDDLDAIVSLASDVRERLERYEPQFWRRHPDAAHNHRAWFQLLLDDASHRVVVHESPEGPVDGFIIGRAMDAPPVYDPGGRSCLVEDFAWTDIETAELLLAELRTWASSEGCVQLIVVTAAADTDRRTLLEVEGFRPTTEWWVTRIDD